MSTDPSSAIPQPPKKLGKFLTGKAERMPHGFYFYCDFGNPFDANGLAYSTEPLPSNLNHSEYFTRITGNWYTIWRPDPDIPFGATRSHE
jgi:hypothetical protein